MFKKKEQLTRLGDVLVDKGIISKAQLDIAIQEQNRRKKLLDPADPAAKVTPIGEILIELGFIDQLQLKRGLNWQQHLRHVSIAMALCAPFMMFMPNIARAAPTQIEAESYSAMQGIELETTKDIGGGQNISYFDAGDWMNYDNANLVIPKTGLYKFTYRVANRNAGGVLLLKNMDTGEVLDTVTVPKTGSWQAWVSVESTITLPKGVANLQLAAKVGGFNVNWFKIEDANPQEFPVLVQAEDYTSMSGVLTEVTKDTGGGTNVSYLDAGDWLNYENLDLNIPTAGDYKVTYRVANRNTGGVLVLKNLATGAVMDTVTVPKTGSWQTWVDVTRTVNFPAGPAKLQVYVQGGGFNLNWFKVDVLDSGTTVTPPIVISSSSASSSSKPAVSSSSQAAVSSSAPAAVSSSSSSSSSSQAVSSSSSSQAVSSSSSSKSSSSAAAGFSGPVGITWTAPTKRANGSDLYVDELGGYEIRYKKATDDTYTYVTINDAWTQDYRFDWLEGEYEFQIAAFDKNGVYSPFVDIQRQ